MTRLALPLPGKHIMYDSELMDAHELLFSTHTAVFAMLKDKMERKEYDDHYDKLLEAMQHVGKAMHSVYQGK